MVNGKGSKERFTSHPSPLKPHPSNLIPHSCAYSVKRAMKKTAQAVPSMVGSLVQ